MFYFKYNLKNEQSISKSPAQDESQSSEQPRLPKLKLKIGGGGNGAGGSSKPNMSGSNTSLNQDRTKSPITTPSTSMSMNQLRSLTPTNQKMVKPIKISLLNKSKSQGPGMDASKSGEKLSTFASNLMAMKSKSNINPNDANPEQLAALLKKFNQNPQKQPPHIEDEPELGEIVRPKPTFPNQMTKEQMLQRQQQRKSLPAGMQKRPMGQQQGLSQGKSRPPPMQHALNLNLNEQKKPQGADGNSEQVPKM